MDFVILKVNGRDVSQSSHEEAVEAFLQAQEPITVEVLRRGQPASLTTLGTASSVPNSARNSVYIPTAKSPSQSSLIKEPTLLPNDNIEVEEELELSEDIDEVNFSVLPGLDYEEVLLHRSNGAERLGLTLCYETDAEDGLTDIFIDDIHPEGLAAQDGRLRLGDQIIQINGIDVKTKAQAQEIFGKSTGDIRFLVARPPGHHFNNFDHEVDSLDFQEDEEAALLSCDTSGLVAQHEDMDLNKSNRNSFGTNGSGDSLLLEVKKHNTSTGSSSHDYSFTSQSSNGSSTASHNAMLQPQGQPTQSQQQQPQKVRKASSSSQDSGLKDDLNTSKSSKSNSSVGSKEVSLDKELYYVDKKLKDIKMDCEAISAKHNLRSPNPISPMMSTSLLLHSPNPMNEPIYETIPEVSENDEQVYSLPFDNLQHQALVSPVHKSNLSSKKGTQFSSKSSEVKTFVSNKLTRSTSLSKYYDKNKNLENIIMSSSSSHTVVVEPEDEETRQAKLKEVEHWLKQSLSPSQKNGGGPTLQLHSNNLKSSSALSLIKPTNPVKRKPAQRKVVGKMPLKGTMPRPQSLVTPASHDIMYTDMENLEATMKLQQELMLRQQQQQQPKNGVKRSPAVFQAPPPPAMPPPPLPTTEHEQPEENWEWKVKIRPDGTRYIARRPTATRNKLLKERAKKFEERGATTDDDAMSELKIGRYWSKEERKKHLEKAKERRKKQLNIIQQQNQNLKKSPSASANISGYRNKSPVALTPPPPPQNSSSSGSLLTSEPVLLSVTTV